MHDNVLFLKYEDMKKDITSAVSRIARFIWQSVSQELVEEISMKKDNSANYEWIRKYQKPSATNFLRKGEVGDWKNYFTPEQIARLDAVYEEKMKGSGLDFEYH